MSSRLLKLLAVVLLFAFALAVSHAHAANPEPKPASATLTIANRPIVEFRANLLEFSPAQRVERAKQRFAELDDRVLALPLKALPASLGDLHGISIMIGDIRMFSMLEADLDPEEQVSLAQAAEQARARLADAINARKEQRRLPVLLKGAGFSAIATVLLFVTIFLLQRLGHAVNGWLESQRVALAATTPGVRWEEYVLALVMRLLKLGRWALVLSILYGWLTFVVAQFPLTQPLGDRLTSFITGLVEWLGEGALASIPGIVTVVVVLFVTRATVEIIGQFFQRIQGGDTQVSFVHPETASATRRIVTIIAWVLGLVVAYPFIPGSSSDAFKGLSVLFGVIISLGSSGLVTQIMSGLVVIYSRALRKGDFVTITGVEGVVTEIGTLATKVVTMRNEEITIPNSVLVGNVIHNYSKLSGSQGTLLSTKVTIGYDTPWRQVHALLQLAAKRTTPLRAEPKPFVFQRALQDFYVEYELFAHLDSPLERASVLSILHANIQDAFNEFGVQIMSPHFRLQPRDPVVVPPQGWYPPPAIPPKEL